MEKEDLPACAADMVRRALNHSAGDPTSINIKIEEIRTEDILRVHALPVSSRTFSDPQQALDYASERLRELGIAGDALSSLMADTGHIRGAVILDASTLERRDPDPLRGVRATCMDAVPSGPFSPCKQHFREALVLASKVASAPHIVAEVCISDDPDYVTGYVASRTFGYIRLSPMKQKGDPSGGRIFFYRGPEDGVRETIDYIEKRVVLVDGVPVDAVPEDSSLSSSLLSGTDREDADLLHADPQNSGPTGAGPSDAVRSDADTRDAANFRPDRTAEHMVSRDASQDTLSHTLSRESQDRIVPDRWTRIEETLTQLQEQHLLRRIHPFSGASGVHGIDTDGRHYLQFASNDYLGLAQHPRVRSSAADAARAFGAGSTGSRLTTGTHALHIRLENELARVKKTEACLLFSSGYMANLGTIQALCSRGDVILSDSLNHASIIDGCRLSGAEIIVYRHNDMDDLETKAHAVQGRHGIIVSDAVFSMDGDILDLPRFLAIAERYGLLSMIDEAHATGVLGATGRGTVEYFGCGRGADITVGTLSKALGSEGGFVCGRRLLTGFLKNRARSFIFSTALSPAPLAAAYTALDIMLSEPQHVQDLQRNIRFCIQNMQAFRTDLSETAIFPVILGDEGYTVDVASRLQAQGFFVLPIRYPSCARGQARIRLTVRADHTEEDILRLCTSLRQAETEVRS